MAVFVVRNILHQTCQRCGRKHDFFSRPSDHARCGTPVGMSKSLAIGLAQANNLDPDEAVTVPVEDMLVVLDSSARKLKQKNNKHVQLDQVILGVISA